MTTPSLMRRRGGRLITFVAFDQSVAPIRVVPIELASELSVCIMSLRGRGLMPAAQLLIDYAREVVSPLANTGARRKP